MELNLRHYSCCLPTGGLIEKAQFAADTAQALSTLTSCTGRIVGLNWYATGRIVCPVQKRDAGLETLGPLWTRGFAVVGFKLDTMMDVGSGPFLLLYRAR